jgi:hypothetical protein
MNRCTTLVASVGAVSDTRTRFVIDMPQITTFESNCASCGASFASPQLSELAYGEFVLTGMRGTVYAHLAAIGNEAWDFVQCVIPNADADTFQELVARLADPVDNQPFTMSHVCPACQSNDLASWGGDRIGSADVRNATFNAFLALPRSQRQRRVLKLLEELTQ